MTSQFLFIERATDFLLGWSASKQLITEHILCNVDQFPKKDNLNGPTYAD